MLNNDAEQGRCLVEIYQGFKRWVDASGLALSGVSHIHPPIALQIVFCVDGTASAKTHTRKSVSSFFREGVIVTS